ncbi:MAG: NifU family protein [Erysipelotrichaceae bacterium]
MEEQVLAVIEKIRPYIQMDGGDLEFVSLDEENGIVYIKMGGACVGCFAIDDTLTYGIEAMMLEEVDGVKEVRLIDQ